MTLALAMFGGTAAAQAQVETPLAFDPNIAGQGATLLVALDEAVMSVGREYADSIELALPRGTRVDTAAREQLCPLRDARRATCPETSRIGFGRLAVDLRGYALGTSETELGWAIDAYLGEPLRRGDAASVVLISKLLGADLVGSLLAPALGGSVPGATTTIGRLTARGSGVELQFDKFPVEFDLPAPLTVTPARLELALGAVRRIRQNFTRRIRVRTLEGYRILKVKDHRLVGHHLLRAPKRCTGTWSSDVRVGLPRGVRRTAVRMPCTKPPG